jgi:hypothetical protein
MAKGRLRTVGRLGYPVTPDGRYFLVRGRLWRMSDPGLLAEKREALQKELMAARAALGRARRGGDAAGRAEARGRIEKAKRALGERGPVWWEDGAKDYNRHLAKNTPYAGWAAGVTTKIGHEKHEGHEGRERGGGSGAG